ncbi:MAG: response regulator, partial [Bacteroidota bacterium]
DTSTQSVPIVLTMIIEEDKVGWEPEIFDFVTGALTNSCLENLVSKVETHFENKVLKVVLLGENQSEYEQLKNFFENNYEIVFISSLKDAAEQIQNVNPQLVIVDITSYFENALQISFELSQNRLTKNIPIVLKLPEEFSAGEITALNAKLREITLKVKAHPLDVLKVLKDRLKITDYETNKKINLIEETPVDASERIEESNNIKPTVLIVDDDNDALFTIGEFVRELNCDTIFAHNGMECLLTLNHVEPDLIFLDIMMPQMDGFETIKRIRGEKRFARIPVIALTAYAMLDNKDIIEKNGFDDLVTKPINSQMISSKLKKFLNVKVG